MLKYSRQRECIKQNLVSRFDHPTAEMVYADIHKEYPKISLGTVYRNLTLLAELGEIQKLSTGYGPDRFDGNPAMHSHFTCTKCGKVIDLFLKDQEELNRQAAALYGGSIETNVVHFYGTCKECLAPTE